MTTLKPTLRKLRLHQKAGTMFLTTVCNPIMSSNLRVSAPSNKIMATENDTNGNKSAPKSASVFKIPVKGPAAIPANNKNIIAGSLILQATH